MRINRIRGRGFIAFPGDFDVDLDIMNGEVSAVVGANGAGKSTLLEITAGAVIALNKKFLQTPTRGPLKDLAIARDAFIEVTFEYEKHYIVKHSIDAKSGKIETSITCDGAPVLQKGQVSEYLAWAIQTLPPAEVFYASLFAAQGNKGLLGMKEGPRKETILRVLGLERLEKLAKCGRDRASIVSAELSGVRARISELESTRTVGEYRMEVSRLTDSSRRAEDALRLGEITVKELRTKNEAIIKQRTEYDAFVTQKKALELEEQKLRRQITELETKLSVNRELMVEEPGIVAAVIQLRALESHLKAKQEADRNLRVDESGISGRLAIARSEYGRGERRQTELLAEIKRGDVLIAGKEKALAAANSIAEFEESLKETEYERDQAEAELEQLQNANVVGLAGRVSNFRRDTRFIAEGTDGGDPSSFASGMLENDDKLEKADEEQPTKLRTAKAAWQQARDRAKEIAAQIASLRREADQLTAIEAVEQKQGQLQAELAQVEAEMLQANASIVSHSEALDRSTRQIEANDSIIAQLTADIEALKPLAAKADILAGTKVRIEEMELQLVPLKGSLESTLEEAHGVSFLAEPPKLINLSAEEQAVDGARTDLSNCQAALAVAQRDLATAEEKERRREELTIQAQGLEEKQSDWTRLAQDLGKDGLQALEIAAAGSEITTLANDLLQSAGDPRTVSVETVRMDSTGKRELEGCEITVMESGKPDKTAEQLSGGEGVFVGEALSLAMVMVSCRRSAASSPTIVRDESGSALDAGHGPMYVAMLRRAAEIVGAARVLFVSHSADLQALADSTISIAAGSISTT